MPAKIWEMYQEPAYAVNGQPVTIMISVKNDNPNPDTIWVTAHYDSTTCIDHAAIGMPGGMVFRWWTCNCGNFMEPSVTVHIEAGHGGSGQTIPDDVYDFVIYPGTALDCGHGGPYTGNPGIPIQFNCFAQGGVPPYNYEWDFGDGIGTAITQNPTYAYPAAGDYDVKLTVYDNDSRTIFKYTTATIEEEPPPYITCYRCPPDGGTMPEEQQFPGTECPEGWYPTPPTDCGGESPGINPLLLLAGTCIIASIIAVYVIKK